MSLLIFQIKSLHVYLVSNTNHSIVITKLPVHQLPVHQLPVHQLPVHQLPVHQLPVHQLPVHQLPGTSINLVGFLTVP